jgi:hypothetical protein
VNPGNTKIIFHEMHHGFKPGVEQEVTIGQADVYVSQGKAKYVESEKPVIKTTDVQGPKDPRRNQK